MTTSLPIGGSLLADVPQAEDTNGLDPELVIATAELANGKKIRDYLNVREAGRMIVETALSGAQGPVNICSGIPITVRQLAEQIADE